MGREHGRQASARGQAREAAGTTSRLSAPGLERGLAGSSISRHSVLGLVRGLLSTLGQARGVQRKRCSMSQNMSGVFSVKHYNVAIYYS